MGVRLVRPVLPPWEELAPHLEKIHGTGLLTRGPYNEMLETEAASHMGEGTHVVAVSSCTSGLMLVLKALEIRGEVLMPSFTWTASGLAALWNGCEPMYADVTPGRYTLNPDATRAAITKSTGAVMAVNAYGLYPDMDALAQVCREAGVPLVSDSAQGIGAICQGRPAGSVAPVEVFSMSPSKVVTAAEGGLIATADGDLAAKLRRMRDYGKSADGQDVTAVGLSARLSEFHAAIAWLNMKRVEELRDERFALAARYREHLADLPGVAFQDVPEGDKPSGNYMMLFIGPEARADRAGVVEYLKGRDVDSRPYFYPALHRQAIFADRPGARGASLPVTEAAEAQGLALPFYNGMTDAEQDEVIGALRGALAPPGA
ncbi:DegT/DnrJ/EryC1/StrS family aminotransferase [bacterium]|nr:DegT/DnrJ/EryC1/StrS family aminotransferase [bacterium]